MKTRLTPEELAKAHGSLCGITLGDGPCSCLVHWVEALQKEADDTNLQVSTLMSLLKRCEWGDSSGSEPVKICPVCEQDEGYGHNDDCELAEVVGSTNFNPSRNCSHLAPYSQGGAQCILPWRHEGSHSWE